MRVRNELLAAVAVLGLLGYVAWRVKNAGSAAAGAITGAAGAGWNLMQTPVVDPSLPGAGIANGIVAAPSNTLDGVSFGLIGGTNNGSGGIVDTLKAGPFGGLVGMLSGDGNTNIFGPAPSAGLDFGNGTGNW